MIVFGAIALAIAILIITSVVSTVDQDPVRYIDYVEDCKERVFRKAPVWGNESDCESEFVGPDAHAQMGTKVRVKTSIPNDPEECVRILSKESLHKGEVTWIPTDSSLNRKTDIVNLGPDNLIQFVPQITAWILIDPSREGLFRSFSPIFYNMNVLRGQAWIIYGSM